MRTQHKVPGGESPGGGRTRSFNNGYMPTNKDQCRKVVEPPAPPAAEINETTPPMATAEGVLVDDEAGRNSGPGAVAVPVPAPDKDEPSRVGGSVRKHLV